MQSIEKGGTENVMMIISVDPGPSPLLVVEEHGRCSFLLSWSLGLADEDKLQRDNNE